MDPHKPKRAGANERGYTYRWQQASKRFLRDNPLCVRCKAKSHVVPSTTVDHKVPHRGDDDLFWDRANWQALCKPCHDTKTLIEERGLVRRTEVGADGQPLDPDHPWYGGG